MWCSSDWEMTQGKWGRYFIVYIIKWEQVDGAVKKLDGHYDEIIKEDKHFLSLQYHALKYRFKHDQECALRK